MKDLGYRMGEAVVAAVTLEPDRICVVIDVASRFNDVRPRGSDNAPTYVSATAAINRQEVSGLPRSDTQQR